MLERLLPGLAAILALLGACPPWPDGADPGARDVRGGGPARHGAQPDRRGGRTGHPARPGAPRPVEIRVSSSLFGGVGRWSSTRAGFDGNVTSRESSRPSTRRCPTRFSTPLDGPPRARPRPGGYRAISAEETRRQVALGAAQAYLAVVAAQRQRRSRFATWTRPGLEAYARARLEAGQGSRLNHVRSTRSWPPPRGSFSSPSSPGARPRKPGCLHLRRRSVDANAIRS